MLVTHLGIVSTKQKLEVNTNYHNIKTNKIAVQKMFRCLNGPIINDLLSPAYTSKIVLIMSWCITTSQSFIPRIPRLSRSDGYVRVCGSYSKQPRIHQIYGVACFVDLMLIANDRKDPLSSKQAFLSLQDCVLLDSTKDICLVINN